MSKLKSMSNLHFEKIFFNGKKGFLITISEKGDHSNNQDSVNKIVDLSSITISIADGLGSAKNSAVGSKLATEIACDYAFQYDLTETSLKNIYKLWVDKINSNELLTYDTTLKVVKIVKNQIMYTSIGDGCAYIKCDKDDEFLYTENDFSNQTDTLCTNKLISSSYYRKLPYKNEIFLLMYTDGIEYFLDDDKIPEFSKHLIDLYNSNDSFIKSLDEWVYSWREKKYYDDKTMTILYLKGIVNEDK